MVPPTSSAVAHTFYTFCHRRHTLNTMCGRVGPCWPWRACSSIATSVPSCSAPCCTAATTVERSLLAHSSDRGVCWAPSAWLASRQPLLTSHTCAWERKGGGRSTAVVRSEAQRRGARMALSEWLASRQPLLMSHTRAWQSREWGRSRCGEWRAAQEGKGGAKRAGSPC